MHETTASGLTTKWINAHTVNNVENAAATTTLRWNVKRKINADANIWILHNRGT